MIKNSVSTKKRLIFVLGLFTFLICVLIFRVGWLQFVQGSELQKKAQKNQTQETVINSSRGTIYDRNGVPLAENVLVDTVTADPNVIKSSKTVKPEEVAKTLSDILAMDYDDVYKKITKSSNYEIIKRKIETPMSDEIKKAQLDKKLPGISLVDDQKRVYPLSNFAANVIGFTGTDNQALAGIELQYDSYLKGTQGRVLFTKDASGREIANTDEEYVQPQNGDDVYLTIDEQIQHFAESALEAGVTENKVKRGAAIVMDPKTGEILALAIKPDFNLNDPFTPTNEDLKAKWDSLTSNEKSTELQQLWKNWAVSDTYEPGSVFKMVTSAAALEEGVVKLTDMFNCDGLLEVAKQKIRCWSYPQKHGLETFVQGVQNSCNVVFMQVGQRLGAQKLYNYIKGFGLMDKTGIDLPGEAPNSIFHKLNKIGPVELATYSFGQGFQVTPIQMISAVCAVANDGKLVKPRIVKNVKDDQGKVVKSFEPEFIRQVISKETSQTLRNILESVVSEGTGKNAYIEGFRIAGKTGTSEKLPRGSGKYIASFGAFAPSDNPRIAVLVILDEPNGATYYGGQIAAPVVKQIIDETMRYLGVKPNYTPEELQKHKDTTVPDVRNMPISQAEKTLEDSKLKYSVEGEGDAVAYQLPMPGYKLSENSSIFVYLNKSSQPTKKKVPDISGLSVAQASKVLSDSGLNIKINGDGKAKTQNPAAGEEVEAGTVVSVEFIHSDIKD